MTECAEGDRLAYQQNLLEQRNTHLIFKHLTSLNKICNLPRVLIKDGVSSRNIVEKVNKLNHYFQSVFTAKEHFNIKDIEPEKPRLTNFSIWKRNFRRILAIQDIKKAREPDGQPPI